MSAAKLSVVVFSGTLDRLAAVSIIASGAAAMGVETNLFFTFWGLAALRKDAHRKWRHISSDYGQEGSNLAKLMEEKKVPSWLEVLRQAKDLGRVKVYACAMAMDLMGLKMEDLEDVVDEVTGVASFIETSQGGQVLFV